MHHTRLSETMTAQHAACSNGTGNEMMVRMLLKPAVLLEFAVAGTPITPTDAKPYE